MDQPAARPLVAIACGGTGGHLFPGMAVAEVLQESAVDVVLLISPKEVDQMAVQSRGDLDILTLPAVGLDRGQWIAFGRGFLAAYRLARKQFSLRTPQVVAGLGGFTSAPPVLAGKAVRAATILHEANSIPGRANRWLAPWVDHVFVNFPGAAMRLRNPAVTPVGMPVRSQFQPMDPSACRIMLGLQPHRPVLLVMGGSQGASALNQLVVQSLPGLAQLRPDLQYLHLTGPAQESQVRQAYAERALKAVVRPFLTEMELALNAATLAVSRAGASSLAEMAALSVPAFLIPYPTAADNHQSYNAKTFVEGGAARLIEQAAATPSRLAGQVAQLLSDHHQLETMRAAMARWHRPMAAEEIARYLLGLIGVVPAPRPHLAVDHLAAGFTRREPLTASTEALRLGPRWKAS